MIVVPRPEIKKEKRAVSFGIIAIDQDCDRTQRVNQKGGQPNDKYTRKTARFPASKKIGDMTLVMLITLMRAKLFMNQFLPANYWNREMRIAIQYLGVKAIKKPSETPRAFSLLKTLQVLFLHRLFN